MTVLRTLFVDASEGASSLVQETLSASGFDVRPCKVDSELTLHTALESGPWDIVFSERSPVHGASSAMSILKDADPDIPVIFIAEGASEVTRELRLEAQECLPRAEPSRLAPAVQHALDLAKSRRRQRELERLKSVIFRNSLDILCMADPEGRFLELSSATKTVLGYEPEELVGRHFTTLLHPDELGRLTAELAAVLNGQNFRELEARCLSKCGKTVHLSWSVTFSREDNVLIGVGRDITERKHHEETQRHGEEKARREGALLRALIDSTPDLVFYKDKNYRYLGCNRAFENYLGLSERELVGKTDFDILPEEWARHCRNHDEKLLSAGEPQRTEERIPSTVFGRSAQPQELMIFDTLKTPLYGPSGEAFGLLGISRDIAERKQMEAALREERDFSDAVLNGLPGIFYHFEDSGRFVRWNKNFERVSGYSPEELAGMHALDFFAEEEKALVASRVAQVYENGEAQVEANLLLRDGRRVPHLFTGVYFEQNGRKGFIGIALDISWRKSSEERLREDLEERTRMERALREKTALFEAQVESSIDGILVLDRAGNKVIQNQRLNEIWKFPPEIANNPAGGPQFEYVLKQVKNPELVAAKVASLDTAPDAIFNDTVELVDGTVLEFHSAPVRDREGQLYARTMVFRDISERKRAEERIRHLATHDGLTNLPNRNLIQDRIVQAIANARRTGRKLALLYLDLDRFKVLNDAYGHPFGDRVLKAAAERLNASVRASDTVARLGGDEFLVLLTNLSRPADAYTVTLRVMYNMNRPLTVQGREVHLTGSVGVSVFPEDGETAETLIGNADVAMYRAKNLGRSTYQFFTREMSEETQRNVDLETKLRGAVAAGQLALAFQPKVNLETGRITGCEALLRWNHPELGLVPPARFIPIAEESGLIVPIGDWVLHTACAQAKAWLDAGLPPVSVAVNVSARQFLRQDVVSWVKRTLEETGLPPAQLELELTESLIARDVEKVLATVKELKASGVKLSIDDFGTGYSSLSYLKRFRVDTLKIDQSFVRNLLTEPDDATIVLAVIALAHNLKVKVIAEGVETEEHYQFLRQHRCDEIQGYFFSKPVPADAFQALLRENKRLPPA